MGRKRRELFADVEVGIIRAVLVDSCQSSHSSRRVGNLPPQLQPPLNKRTTPGHCECSESPLSPRGDSASVVCMSL